MSKRSRATPEEVQKSIKGVRAFHQLGRKALQLPHTLTLEQQAAQLGCEPARLAVARRFARPKTGYSDAQLKELCALILEHQPVFGTSHVEILLAIPWPRRKTFQSRCVRKNWSRRQLIAAKVKRFRPKSAGGRHPQVTPDNAPVELKGHANALCRLVSRMEKCLNGRPNILSGLPANLCLAVKAALFSLTKLRQAACAHLSTTQQPE